MADISKMTSLNTRLKLKFDSYSNWLSNNPTLLEGEVAIAYIETGSSTDPVMPKLPNIVMKVGQYKTDENGQKVLYKFNELPFVSALAADVHTWAKKSVPDREDFTWLEEYVDGRVDALDTNTQYKIEQVEGKVYTYKLMSQELPGAEWAQVGPAIDLSAVGTRLDELEGLVGADEGKSVAEQIANALSGLDFTVAAEPHHFVTGFTQTDGKIEKPTYGRPEIDDVDGLTERLSGIDGEIAKKQNELSFTEDYKEDTSIITTKEYVDGVATSTININNNDAAVGGKFVTEAKQENGYVSVQRRGLETGDFPVDDKAVVPLKGVIGLDTALKGKQNVLKFMTDPSDSNKVATATEIGALDSTIKAMNMPKKTLAAGEMFVSAEQSNGVVNIVKRDIKHTDYVDDQIPERAVKGLTKALAGKQETVIWADGHAYNPTTNKGATVSYVNEAVAGLNGAMHFIGVIATVEEVENKVTFEQALANKGITNPKGGDVVLFGYEEYVYNAASSSWVELGNENLYYLKDDAVKEHAAIWEELGKKVNLAGVVAGYHETSNQIVTESFVNEKITQNNKGLAHRDTGTAGTFARTVTQENGLVSVTYEALKADDFADKTNIIPITAVNGLKTALDGKQAILEFMTKPTSENKVATKAEIDSLDSTIKGMDLTKQENNAGAGKVLKYIEQSDGKVTAEFRDIETADFKDNLINQSAIIGLATSFTNADTAAKGYANTAESNAKSHADTEIAKAIQGIDFEIPADSGKFVTGFKVEDGKMTAKTTSAVDAKYLTQTTGEYLIFDCGSSSVNV